MPATGPGGRTAELAEAAWLAALLPSGAALAALAGPAEPLPLPPGEADRAAGLPRGRAGEFAAGRWCAHRALERLGRAEAEIGSGRHGEPCWPAGFTGSISHKPGAAVAVAAAAPGAIGIDLEDAVALPPGVRRLVLLPAEPALVPGFPVPEPVAERVVFSAKEAYYKWHGSAHGRARRPGFPDVRIRLRAGQDDYGQHDCAGYPGYAAGPLRAEPAPASGLPPASGAWVCGPRWILTAVWAARRPVTPSAVPSTRP
jgi:4'-phosphopantetheinyl transferase EntD